MVNQMVNKMCFLVKLNCDQKWPVCLLSLATSWPLWHSPAHAEHLPGVCSQSPVQPADPGPLQTEPWFWQAAEAVWV